jgi:RNA polymerase sigma-70 factor, ECF subfamily
LARPSRSCSRTPPERDEHAFAVLYRDLQPSVLRYLRILAPGAAEDLAAETWLRVVGKLIRWSPIRTGKPPARPWTT